MAQTATMNPARHFGKLLVNGDIEKSLDSSCLHLEGVDPDPYASSDSGSGCEWMNQDGNY
jgi:hypothetical protein